MDGAETKPLAGRAPRKRPLPTPPARSEPASAREATAGEVAALVRLAEVDAGLLDRGSEAPVDREVADERRELAARLAPETLEAYERALRAGRKPPVVRLTASVCSGCHMRLHSKLDHQVRQRRGIAPCPYCLRLVYDATWLAR